MILLGETNALASPTDLLALLIAYALGCLSTAYYLVRWRCDVDIRTLGSGNAGATNAGRILGRWGFAAVFAGDLVKGMVAVALARQLTDDSWIIALVVPVVVAGHIWPIQLGLRGGEGFATALGALLIYDPQFTAILVVVALLVYGLTRARSMTGAIVVILAPLIAWLTGRALSEITALLILNAMILWAFRHHLRSLIVGRKRDAP